MSLRNASEKRCPIPFSVFSAPTGSSAAGSQSRQPAGWLSAACRGEGGRQGCPTQLSKEACYKLGYHEAFLQRFLSGEGQWGAIAHFPLSHDQGCLRFMSHLCGFITYLASWPSEEGSCAARSSCVLSKWQSTCPVYTRLLSPANGSWSSARVSAHKEGFGRCGFESFTESQNVRGWKGPL